MKFRNILQSVSVLIGGQEEGFEFSIPAVFPLDGLLMAAPDGAGTGKPTRTRSANEEEGDQSQEVPGKTNKQKQDQSPSGIANPDSPLTGDTGNTDVGQTDLGATGTGIEDPATGNEPAER